MKLFNLNIILFLAVVVPYIQAQPINDECIDAMAIDASKNVTIIGDTTNAIPSFPGYDGKLIPGVWYQDESSVDEVVVGTACAKNYLFYPAVVIFRKDVCENLDLTQSELFDINNCVRFETTIGAGQPFKIFIFLFSEFLVDTVKGKFNMTLSTRMANPPPNDECIEAITVDATSNEMIVGDTTDAGASIVPDNTIRGVWYKVNSAIDAQVTATICNDDSSLQPRAEIFSGENCESLEVIPSLNSFEGECNSFTYPNDVNQLHWLLVYVRNDNYQYVGGKFNMTLSYIETNPPPNDECADAIIVDPIAGQEVIGATLNSFSYAVYYKSEGVFGDDISITATLCTEAGVSNALYVYAGDDCNNRISIGDSYGDSGCTIYQFVPNQHSIFYYEIFTRDETDESKNEFTFAISSTRTFFELIDSTMDISIGALQNKFSYGSFLIKSSQLNIRANFDASIPVESVRLTLTNPTRSICERVAPYSLFGDIDGNYKNGSIPLGSHVVTATPYAQRSCRGPAGPKLTQTFEVEGCYLNYNIYDENGYVERDYDVDYFVLPCRFNIEVYVSCGFEPSVVKLDLRNTATNRIIRSVKDLTYPYELYNGIVDTLGVGNYTLSATINGLYHPPTDNFVVNEACV